jgi:hypothetical protein
MQAKMDRPAATKLKGKTSGKAKGKASRFPRESNRLMPEKENGRARKDQAAIEDALGALESLSVEIHRLESELKSLFK